MAYSAISDEEIEPGKPGSNALLIKLRDNPEAIAQGLSGATKLNGAAITDGTLKNEGFNDKTLSFDKLTNVGSYNASLPKIIPFGMWILRVNEDDFIETNVNGTWRNTFAAAPQGGSHFLVFSDGINVRTSQTSNAGTRIF